MALYKPSKKRFHKISLAVGMVVLFILILWLSMNKLPPKILYHSKIKNCEVMISRIESYKIQTGHYPSWNDWGALGVKDESDPRFYRVTADGYVVGFSLGFDENYEWDPKTKHWSFDD